MAAPIPIQFFMAKPPVDEPANVQELINTVGHSLGTEFTPASNLILGHMDGVLPAGNVGPWANNGQWWFWSAGQGRYIRAADGVPIGLITIWGGTGAPVNWLTCDGSEVSRTQYAPLFQQIGVEWGGGDGATTFNLPTGACFYLADGNFSPDPAVPLIDNASNNWGGRQYGWGTQGGAQVVPLLTADNLPQLKVTIKFTMTARPSGIAGVAYLNPPGRGGQAATFQILGANDTPLNTQAQTQFPCMPPFAAANFIIKYQ